MTTTDVSMFREAFFQEAVDLLNDLETHLLLLEERKDDRELLNTIFRCAHSIKGGSATFGLPEIASFTHGLETLLDLVRSGQVPVSGELCEVLLLSLDQMRALLSKAMGQSPSAPDGEALTARINALSQTANFSPNAGSVPAPPEKQDDQEVRYLLSFAPGPDVMRTGCDPCLLLAQLVDIATIHEVRRDESQIPPLSEMDPEACYTAWEIELTSAAGAEAILEAFDFIIDESQISCVQIAAPSSQTATNSVETAGASQPGPITDAAVRPETTTLRVPAEKVDRLVDLVGELVISQSMLNEVTRDVDLEKQPRLFEAVGIMERACRELQERVMGIRLVQLKHAFARFPRLVRDLSAAVGKKIELVTVGEETELDKSLIEALGDPLTHLVRNSIDHGLESPEERRSAGKSETGTIKIASHYEGGNVIIEVSDDGRGLDHERILAKAKERGLIAEGETPADEAIHALIFHPGFSTASQVTDLSGRGVGMDIVRQAIHGMNGSIGLTTRKGSGTKFRIRLPLTMAIMEGLSIRVGTEIYILPLTSIVESLRPARADITLVAGAHELVRVRNEILPILRLHEFFGVQTDVTDPCEALLVIVENEDQKIALLVDELITQNQAVLKSLEANYRKVDGITGATILGDGRVALIIDVPGLFRGIQTDGGAAIRAA